MKTKLKPCPHCGEKANVRGSGVWTWVQCKKCMAMSSGGKGAVARWNRRVRQKPTGQTLRGWVWVWNNGRISDVLWTQNEKPVNNVPTTGQYKRATLTLDGPAKTAKKGKAKK